MKRKIIIIRANLSTFYFLNFSTINLIVPIRRNNVPPKPNIADIKVNAPYDTTKIPELIRYAVINKIIIKIRPSTNQDFAVFLFFMIKL